MTVSDTEVLLNVAAGDYVAATSKLPFLTGRDLKRLNEDFQALPLPLDGSLEPLAFQHVLDAELGRRKNKRRKR